VRDAGDDDDAHCPVNNETSLGCFMAKSAWMVEVAVALEYVVLFPDLGPRQNF
jgi:hypothetical protein